jgi:hypothetical protein
METRSESGNQRELRNRLGFVLKGVFRERGDPENNISISCIIVWRLGFGELGEEAEARGESQATILLLFEFFLLHL